MKLLLAALLASTFSVAAFAQSFPEETPLKLSKREEAEKRLMVEDAYEAPKGQLFFEDAYLAGETDFNDYTNIIVINKKARGNGAQTLRLYTNRRLVLTTPISSGTEEVEYIGKFKGVINGIFKGSRNSHWRHTTRGFYSVKRVYDYNYRSGESKFQMPYAMFFNDARGLAVHQVPPDISGGEANGVAALGQRASSGCVRVKSGQINIIHDAVVRADKGQMPVIDTKTGRQMVDQYGKPQTKVGYRSLVIVEEY
ncbi:murein L,D-transpeptidase [Bdellovibrio sp. ZAP7]|uniref:L,D-transpeptidase n=1 Tax=Bdellovibrio sp. ZAP7 TaxID=2231053 RepID=UPI00115C3E4B|nr:L,D-transpeptidase [Bdellovibrio sp. ZAP7]QDK47131.1 murein L,D-transpeptidase [Bdellovibrio sp. ZAP7]